MPKMKISIAKHTSGVVVSVPAIDSWFILIFITANRFGDAFGVLKGRFLSSSIPPTWRGEVLRMCIYSTWQGTQRLGWKLSEARTDLLDRFPIAPEIYHAKSDNLGNSLIGDFGSAESPNGILRSLSEEEAQEVGLLRGHYRQILLPEQISDYLGIHIK